MRKAPMSTRSRFPQVWLRGVWQAGVILIVAAAMAVIVNHLRQDGLPLVVERSPEDSLVQERLGFSLAVSLDEARALFFARQAVFLDARSPEVYQLGHILGARNLPWLAFDAHRGKIMADIPKGAMIVTYCDGESCHLSEELALALFTEGYFNIRVLVNGWRRWEEHRLPVVTGKSPGSL